MKLFTKVLAAIISAATLAAQVPAVQAALGSFLAHHPGLAAFIAGISSILALIHQPQKSS